MFSRSEQMNNQQVARFLRKLAEEIDAAPQDACRYEIIGSPVITYEMPHGNPGGQKFIRDVTAPMIFDIHLEILRP